MAPFDSEEELERVVIANYEYLFGPDAILLPKALIRSPDGAGTVPDAFAIDLLTKRWFVVEAELASHSVWTHIAPQVAKQLVASSGPSARRVLVELVVDLYKSDDTVRERFEDHSVAQIDVRRVVQEILETQPIVALPIDAISTDLRLWAEQLKAEVRLWTVRKLVDLQDQSRVAYEFPDEFRPSLETIQGGPSGIAVYDVSLLDLLNAGRLKAGDELRMSYKPQGGQKRTYTATIGDDGSISLMGKSFTSPSYAALSGINEAGSSRTTVNGWTSWRTKEGRTLADIREEHLNQGTK